jgi:hypothetical protein
MAIIEILQMLIFGLPLTPRGQTLDLTGYNVVVYDEFEGDSLSTDLWEYRGNGARRGGFNASSQVEVRDGNLVIAGEYLTDGEYGEGWYTAAIKLRERYKNGYFEIKCKVNKGIGYWSAFWIQADSPYTASVSKGGVGGAELDIFESTEYAQGKYAVTNTIHCAGVDGVEEGFQSAMLGKFKGNNISKKYNTYGLEWTEDEYIFYVKSLYPNKYIQLELIGGEPTLHPDLVDFCEKISHIPNIFTTIYTNFSKPAEYYLKLLNIDNRLSLILSWHTSNT